MSRKLSVKLVDRNDVKGFDDLVKNGFKVPRRITNPRQNTYLKKISSKKTYNGTYLHYCVQTADCPYPTKSKLSPSMVKYLMRLGVDERLTDSNGHTPMDIMNNVDGYKNVYDNDSDSDDSDDSDPDSDDGSRNRRVISLLTMWDRRSTFLMSINRISDRQHINKFDDNIIRSITRFL